MLSAQLHALLHLFQVSVESWGAGEAKTVDDLLGEIAEGECYLRVDQSGITRVIEVAKLHILQALYRNRGYLIEVSECPPGRGLSKKDDHPSETLKRGETAMQAAIRGVKEELSVGRDYIHSMGLMSLEIEPRPSKSYPNLTCIYVLHHIEVILLNSVQICHQRKFETMEPDGTVHQWRWQCF